MKHNIDINLAKLLDKLYDMYKNIHIYFNIFTYKYKI